MPRSANSLKDVETGKFVYSDCPQSNVLVRGALYDLTEIVVTCPDVTKMTKWIPARNILCEVKMESAGSHSVLEETLLEKLKKKGFTWEIYHTNTEHSSEDVLAGEPDEEGFFDVEDVVNKEYCRQTHEELYEVKFSGYDSSQNMWKHI